MTADVFALPRYVAVCIPTIRELASSWTAGDFGPPVSKAWAKARRCYMVHIVPLIGDKTAAEVEPEDLRRIQSHCIGAGLAPATANKITHHVFRALLRDAEQAGRAPRDSRARIFEGVVKLREASEAWTALTVTERDAVLDAFADHWAYPLVAFLFFTGVRVGEAAGIRQADVDWSRRTVRIMRSRTKTDITPCKSRRSQRTISLPHAALAAISGLRRDDAPHDFIFRSSWGEPLNQDAFRYRDWLPTLRRAGLPIVRIHDARHTFATIALESGIPIAKVAAYLGDRIQTVEARYAHVVAIEDWDRAVVAPKPLRIAK